MRKIFSLLAVLLLTAVVHADVKVVRVPDGGIEPQAAVDAKGVIHLIYYKGPDNAGDIFYTTSANSGETFADAVRVNSQPGSALAVGGVRGAQMALGREGKIHVAWMGSGTAKPKAPDGTTAFLYASSNADGTFTQQKNIIAAQPGMDGGGSIAADNAGHVYIAWHAPTIKGEGEQGRLVWIAKSIDDGKTFAPEFAIRSGPVVGGCACCSLHIAVGPGGEVAGLFRQADKKVNRATNFFITDARVTKAAMIRPIAPMKSGVCIMSNFSLVRAQNAWLAAYETSGEVYLQALSRTGEETLSVSEGGKGKYPSIALNQKGQILIARAVGTGWKKGGTVAWQIFDLKGEAIADTAGEASDLPAWSYPAALAMPDGAFVVIY